MGSVSPKVEEEHLPEVPQEEAEEEMTSIMSAEQRKALQQAAKTEKAAATLERDTAKPPSSDARPMAIPRAAAVPAEARVVVDEKPEATPQTVTPAKSAVPSSAAAPVSKPGWATWEIVAFVLLAASIVAALVRT